MNAKERLRTVEDHISYVESIVLPELKDAIESLEAENEYLRGKATSAQEEFGAYPPNDDIGAIVDIPSPADTALRRAGITTTNQLLAMKDILGGYDVLHTFILSLNGIGKVRARKTIIAISKWEEKQGGA